MVRWVIAVTLLAAGCNQAFGLKPTQVIDAGTMIDAPLPVTFIPPPAVNEGPGASLDVAFANPLGAGHAVVAGVYTSHTADAAVTDTQGNSYVQIVGPLPFTCSPQSPAYMSIFVALDVRGGPDTITLTSQNGTDLLVMAQELANIAAIEASNGAHGTGNALDAMNSGDLVTTGTNDLIFGFGIAHSASPGTGFTTLSSFHANVTEALVANVPGNHPATGTAQDTSNCADWTMLGAAFRGP